MFPFPFSFLGAAAADVPLELIDNNFAMEFDAASSQYIDAPITALNSIANFTISFWGKRSTTSTVFGVGSKNSATNRMFLSWYSDNIVYFNCKSASGQSAATYSGLSATDTNWHHYIGVFEGGVSQKLYVDGVLRSTITSGIPSLTYSTMGNDFNIGLVDNTSYSDGDIDEVAIWNKALALEDVQTIYNATNDNPGKCANLFTGGLGSGLVFWNRMGD